MVKVSQVNSAHCKNWTCILKRREYEISSLDHLAAKVDALTQKFDKINTSAVTHAPISPLCEVCGIFDHIDIDCQLGSVVRSPEQVNYAQYNQGFRNNQIFFQTPQNLFGQQTAPPRYANNQRVPQKSSLELFLENYYINQSEQVQELKNQTEFLKDSLAKLTSKEDSIVTHCEMLETQTSQVPQQVATSSQTSEVLLGHTETNPKDHISVITLRDGKQLEDPVVKVKKNEG
jgi:ribosomal protein S15P/S13E